MSALPPSLPVPLHELPDGTLRVAGTRVSLDTVLDFHLAGEPAEAIQAGFPTLSLADLYACLAYYHRNKVELDEYRQRRRAQAEELRRQVEAAFPPDGYRAKLYAGYAHPTACGDSTEGERPA